MKKILERLKRFSLRLVRRGTQLVIAGVVFLVLVVILDTLLNRDEDDAEAQ